MSRKAQPRTGRTFQCSLPGCTAMYYAAPSRAQYIEKAGRGYCIKDHMYQDRLGQRTVCPECGQNEVKHPNTYCGPVCYRSNTKRKRQERLTHEYAEAGAL